MMRFARPAHRRVLSGPISTASSSGVHVHTAKRCRAAQRRAGQARGHGTHARQRACTSRARAGTIMVFLIVRIEGDMIEGTSKPLIGLVTLLGLPHWYVWYVHRTPGGTRPRTMAPCRKAYPLSHAPSAVRISSSRNGSRASHGTAGSSGSMPSVLRPQTRAVLSRARREKEGPCHVHELTSWYVEPLHREPCCVRGCGHETGWRRQTR